MDSPVWHGIEFEIYVTILPRRQPPAAEVHY